MTSSRNGDVTFVTPYSKSSWSITYRHPHFGHKVILAAKVGWGGPKFAKMALEPCLVHSTSVSRVRGRPIYVGVPSTQVVLANPPYLSLWVIPI